jgi:hypothetical protein
MNYLKQLKERASAIAGKVLRSKELIYGFAIYMLCRPILAEAGLLGKTLCRQYKQLVDTELFMTISVIVLVILIISWKISKDSKAITNILGILMALAILLNIENILQSSFGIGMGC